ncbi:MAG: hypothetical protein Q8M26_04645 [Pseudolabrys sp.]|nr:hypothetical protein [Pseudolabrys sp.]
MKKSKLALISLASMAVTGCISTQEMPLAPNVVRIDTQSRGLLFTGQTVPQTMRAAARSTLDRGYSHFKFVDASMNQGSVVAGVVSNSNSSFSGTYGGGSVSGNSSGFGSASVVRAPTASAAATVLMFHANEPAAQGAFDAAQVLKQYSQ